MRVFIFLLLFLAFAPPAFATQEPYMCPMHPHITGEKGDTCPICGMDLIAKIKAPISDMRGAKAPENAFQIDPTYIQALGVKTDIVKHYEFGRNIRAFGRLTPSTRLEYAIDMRTKGWVSALYKNAVGDLVKKGDLLFMYYSPDLMTAQSDFLIGSRVGNAEQRLRLHGMSARAIKELKKKGRFFEETPFYAPYDGIITQLDVREGSHVQEGGSIMRIQDFSTLWVEAALPLRDIAFLSLGTTAQITLPETGERYNSVIDYIHPRNDPQSRTVAVRLLLDNEAGHLKTESYVDVNFKSAAHKRLAVPSEAILYNTKGAYVLEDLGKGLFRPRPITTAISANGLTEVKGGLSSGQKIVISGQFMLDAESSLHSTMSAMGMDAANDDQNSTEKNKNTQENRGLHVH